MKPGVKHRVAILKPQGFLDGNNTSVIFNMADIYYIKSLQINALFVSLKSVVSFNSNAITFLASVMSDIGKEMKITIGFCDYDRQKLDLLIRFLGDDHPVSLIEEEKIVYILFGSENPHGEVLLWNENAGQRGVMLVTLHQRGYNVVIARTYNEFLQKKENYPYSIENSFVGGTGTKIVSYIRGNVIIYSLAGFLDASIADNFDYIYHQNLLQTGFRLFVCECSNVSGFNIHATNFFSKLSISMAEYNATLVMAGLEHDQVTENFKEKMELAAILFFDSLEAALEDGEISGLANNVEETHLKNKRLLTRETVAKLPFFIDATITTIETMTGVKAEKHHVAIDHWSLKTDDADTYIGSTLGFYGDIDGMIALAFPRDIAKKACFLLLGEEVNDEEVADSLSEFVNIIAGQTKSNLATTNVKINITLPRTFEGLHDLELILKGKRGAKVDFLMDGKPFSFFLTR